MRGGGGGGGGDKVDPPNLPVTLPGRGIVLLDVINARADGSVDRRVAIPSEDGQKRRVEGDYSFELAGETSQIWQWAPRRVLPKGSDHGGGYDDGHGGWVN